MLSLKNVNAIAHFTDWIIAHVHVGALAWNGFLSFGMIYWLIPRMTKSKLYSDKLANFHFWIGTLGIILYSLPMYVAGFTQASMWKQFKPDGTLQYGNFLETVTQIMPMYWMRAIGGTLYLVGMIVLIYNIIKTVKAGSTIEDELAEAPELAKIRDAITESAASLTQNSAAGWVDVFIACNSLELARLPWETWPFRGIDEESRSKIRIARMAEDRNGSPTKPLFRPVRILAIFGDGIGLDLSKDEKALKAFKSVEDVKFDGWKKGDTRTSWQNRIFPEIADGHWDILFFAGHSNETLLTGGKLGIGPNETITISELRKPLMQAKQNGLQLAIFNSCKGLKMGEALNDMGINQVVIMRHAIHDEVAPEFLKELVKHLDNHKDIHEALIETTAFFEEHPRYTSADLVPSIFRHPESEPFQIPPFGWRAQFKRRLPTRAEGLALAGLCALSLLWPVQDLLLETRVAAQARYRQLTGQLLGQVESPLKLIQVDEDSLKAAEIPDSDSWPIPYDYMAELINQVSEAGAQVIGVDYVLDQPEDNPAELEGTRRLRDAVEAAQDRGTKLVFADGRNHVARRFVGPLVPRLECVGGPLTRWFVAHQHHVLWGVLGHCGIECGHGRNHGFGGLAVF
jgi:uncharacterized protein (DUF433 family)